jgi:hypothetical protein
MTLRSLPILALVALAALAGCRSPAEEEAARLCAEAAALSRKDPRGALELERRLWSEMPTAGTAAARRCLRSVRERMGEIRLLVTEDEAGEAATITGCAWAADAMEVFADCPNPPFRRHWAERLAERCLTVVGRAWTREPNSAAHAELSARLEELVPDRE